MKQKFFINLSKRCLLGLLFSLTFAGLNAQRVAWQHVPSITPATLIVLSDTGYIDIDFGVANAAVSTAKIEVQLPPNLTPHGVVTEADHTAGTFTVPAPSGTLAAGYKLTITPAGSLLNNGTHVHLKVKVIAACAFTYGEATVRVLSGTNQVDQRPTARRVPSESPLHDRTPTFSSKTSSWALRSSILSFPTIPIRLTCLTNYFPAQYGN